MALDFEQLTDVVKNQETALVNSRTLGLPEPKFRGKVRDTYEAGDGRLLIVATDRISTYDCVHPNGISGKGVILTQMTLNWLERLKDIPNHLISADQNDFPEPFRSISKLAHRSMLVQELDMLPVECIVRGHITGSAWTEYKESETVLGQTFSNPLVESQSFDRVLFTPSTKAETGHDENINYEQMTAILSEKYGAEAGKWIARKLKIKSASAYIDAYKYGLHQGVMIADTKFEFGRDKEGYIILADEVLTPDSSRFWPAEKFELGKSQPSFDKQYVRDWATRSGWNKKPPAPVIPEVIAQQTQEKYLEAYSRLFG
ncbi:MAG: phosphoribosylaminoimidazolesuccinocarboxamide synthase [Candidatus Daviesbacteria bacterium]|nr:phosphoribosylaminoimidazolesuccinocarboxamide synthase [Candidatus Daviesbacteria bacterium]